MSAPVGHIGLFWLGGNFRLQERTLVSLPVSLPSGEVDGVSWLSSFSRLKCSSRERWTSGSPVCEAKPRSEKALETQSDGFAVAFEVGGLFAGKGRYVYVYEHSAGPLVRGGRGRQRACPSKLHHTPSPPCPCCHIDKMLAASSLIMLVALMLVRLHLSLCQ